MDQREPSTWIWQTHARAPRVDADDQVLLAELWTGMRLSGGLGVPLTPGKFRSRRNAWRARGGGDWYFTRRGNWLPSFG